MLNQQIPVMKPKLPSIRRVYKYLRQIEKNRTYSNYGPLVERLETRFAEYFGVNKELVVMCANATLAIQGTSFLMPVRRFQVPAYTFPASITGVLNSCKEIQMQDISLNTWKINLSNASVDYGVVEVLPFGAPLNINENPNWIYKIIDAAASIGSEPFQLQDMQPNWVSIFSLHATKVMGIGEGGIAVFKSENFAQEFRSWINFGFSGERNSTLPGINAKMSEVTAAYGHAVLDNWEKEKAKRMRLRKKVDEINDSLSVQSITSSYPGVNPYWIVNFKDSATTKHVEKVLNLSGIFTRRWWSFGCHKMPAFANLILGENFPNTESVAERTLGLPMFIDINDRQISKIRNCIELALDGD
jgi:dTDP-4-amino-4,6-dideoxygalactose transaminase